MKKENKIFFDRLDKMLGIAPKDIAEETNNIKTANIYATYRKESKREHYELLALGTYIKKSGLKIEDLVSIVNAQKEIKSRKEVQTGG